MNRMTALKVPILAALTALVLLMALAVPSAAAGAAQDGEPSIFDALPSRQEEGDGIDTKGEIADGAYQNDWLGVSMALADGWAAAPSVSEGIDNWSEITPMELHRLFYITHGTANLQMLYIPDGLQTFDSPEDFLKELREELTSIAFALTYRVGEIRNVPLGDRTFLMLSCSIEHMDSADERPIYQEIYLCVRDRDFFVCVSTYLEESGEKAEISAMLDTLVIRP